MGLGLLAPPGPQAAPGPQAPASVPSAWCLEWPAASGFQLVTQWCEEVKGLPETKADPPTATLVGRTREHTDTDVTFNVSEELKGTLCPP